TITDEKYSHPEHQNRNPKARNIIRHAKYQNNLALTFIDTLLSSQRTRAHHHRDLQPLAPGQLFQPIPSKSPAQTGTS
ncbi:hypothetical protein EEB13_21290, partial [Rhodococcus sp. WS3]